MGAAHDHGVEHPRQAEIVDIGRLALDQPRILGALDRTADVALHLRFAFRAGAIGLVMCAYPGQRQRFPSVPRQISARFGWALRSSSWTPARIMPGVQKPHWRPWQSQKPFWT